MINKVTNTVGIIVCQLIYYNFFVYVKIAYKRIELRNHRFIKKKINEIKIITFLKCIEHEFNILNK